MSIVWLEKGWWRVIDSRSGKSALPGCMFELHLGKLRWHWWRAFAFGATLMTCVALLSSSRWFISGSEVMWRNLLRAFDPLWGLIRDFDIHSCCMSKGQRWNTFSPGLLGFLQQFQTFLSIQYFILMSKLLWNQQQNNSPTVSLIILFIYLNLYDIFFVLFYFKWSFSIFYSILSNQQHSYQYSISYWPNCCENWPTVYNSFFLFLFFFII